MLPVIASALIATATEAAPVAMSAFEAKSMTTGIQTITEIAESSEVIVSEKGLLAQVDTVRYSSLESVLARNEVQIPTFRNQALAGEVHPETGVPFESELVKLSDSRIVEGTFPEFKPSFETKLTDELLKASDAEQFKFCNNQLRESVDRNLDLSSKFSKARLEQISDGFKPDGYTWHHHQESGRMQLVDFETHMRTGHTGGKEIWGGGRS